MKGLLERIRSARDSEEGMALAGVVMLSAFVFIIISSLMMTSIASTKLTADNRSELISIGSAESGVDDAIVSAAKGICDQTKAAADLGYSYTVYRSASDTAPTNITDPGVSAGCPQDGDKYIVIKSKGTDIRGQENEIVSTYKWVTRVEGTVDGALVSGTASMNLSRLNITEEGADLVLLNGVFDCNNITSISGDLIVLNGTVRISNACKIGGSVYSKGSVYIDNPAVAVDGDVYTLGDFSTSTAATIKGSVYAKGNLTLSSGTLIQGSVIGLGTSLTGVDNVKISGNLRTAGPVRIMNGTVIGGSVISSNTSAVNIYNSKINGSLTIAGSFSQLQTSTIGATVTATRPGMVNAIAPDVQSGNIYLGGTISTWGSGPVATVQQNMAITAPPAPTFTTPKELDPATFAWRDYQYKQADWVGYTVIAPANCDYQSNASLISQVNGLTAPTVIDLRGCSNVQMYGVTFNLKTDVTFVSNRFDNAEQLKLNSANGGNHEFHMIVSDLVDNDLPTCSAGQGPMDIYGLVSDPKITSFFYSPCKIAFGGNSKMKGQIYAGEAYYSAGGGMDIVYKRTGLPGFPSDGTPTNVTYDADAESRAVPVLVSRLEN